MNSDRFQGLLPARTRTAQPAASAFMMCPVALQGWAGATCPWEQVYRMAYEQARAVVRPSIVERLSANLLN